MNARISTSLLILIVGTTVCLTGCKSDNSMAGVTPFTGESSQITDINGMKSLGGSPSGADEKLIAMAQAQKNALKADNSWTGKIKQVAYSVSEAITPKSEVVPAADPVRLSSMPDKINPDVYIGLARVAEQEGNTDAARARYQQVLDKDANHFYALIGLARLEQRSNQYDKALLVYSRAAATHGDKAVLWNDMSQFYARQDKTDESLKALARAIRIEPHNKLYRNNMALLLLSEGKTREAFSEMASVYPPAVAHYNIGYLLSQQQKKAEAIQHLQEALRQDPQLAPARQLIAHLTPKQRNPRPVTQHTTQPHYPTTGIPARHSRPTHVASRSAPTGPAYQGGTPVQGRNPYAPRQQAPPARQTPANNGFRYPSPERKPKWQMPSESGQPQRNQPASNPYPVSQTSYVTSNPRIVSSGSEPEECLPMPPTPDAYR